MRKIFAAAVLLAMISLLLCACAIGAEAPEAAATDNKAADETTYDRTTETTGEYRIKSGVIPNSDFEFDLLTDAKDIDFAGYEEARQLAAKWDALQGKVDEDIFENVKERFKRQLVNAREWCDQVNSYFFRKSGIPDEKNRQIW